MLCRSFLAVSLCALFLALGCDNGGPTVDTDGEVPPDTATWRALGPDFLHVHRLRRFEPYLYACAREQGLWRLDLRDPDSRWQFLGLDHTVAGEPSSGINDVVVHLEHPDWLLAAYHNADRTDHSLYRSLDDGRTWTPTDSTFMFVSDGEQRFREITSLFVYPDRVLANTAFESRDFGETWAFIIEGDPLGVGVGVPERHPTNHELLWTGGVASDHTPILSFSRDGGRHWIRRTDELNRLITGDNEVSSIGLAASDENTIYLGMWLYSQIAKSTDQGATWTLIEPDIEPVSPFSDDSYTSVLVDPADRDRLWVVGRGGAERSTYRLLFSEDGGASWSVVETPFSENVVLSDLLWDEASEAILLATSRGIYRYRPPR